MDNSVVFPSLAQYFQKAADHWLGVAAELRSVFARLDDTSFRHQVPATKFILNWMRELKTYQDKFGALINRRKRPPVADDFTAAVAFSLEQFLAARGFVGLLRCEETTHRKRHALRPDISLRSPYAETLVATIECKTDTGWKRNQWQTDFRERSQRLQALFPSCVCYLCVLSDQKWSYADEYWVCLSKYSPARLTNPITESDILAPIEPMFLAILAKASTSFTSDALDALGRMSEAERADFLRQVEARKP